MEIDSGICPICKLEEQKCVEISDAGERISFECNRCGKFRITDGAVVRIKKSGQAPALSAWVRNKHERGIEIPEIDTKYFENIIQNLSNYSPSNKQLLLLQNIARKSKYPGYDITLDPNIDYPLCWGANPEELKYYIKYLCERNLLAIRDEKPREFRDHSIYVEVTAYGWEYLDQEGQRALELNQVFVAMSFSDSMNIIWTQGIKPAINDSGYNAYRVDAEPHLERIDAKIITEIKNSLFVVADVTEQRPGVYFEAGYALGKNLPVIWCVRKDELEKVHFDTRQYNHIVWESADELKEKLYYFICALIGKRHHNQ